LSLSCVDSDAMLKAFFGSKEWAKWAWGGLFLIIAGTWYAVHVDVLLNRWSGKFYDLLGKATSESGRGTVATSELVGSMLDFAKIAFIAMLASVVLDFFISHWTFRWRTALTDSYIGRWEQLRHIEGASQRIQEDTMRLAKTLESLGEQFVRCILTLIAFLPLLAELSSNVTTLPLIGPVKNSLVWAAILWSIFGTVILAVTAIKLPGLEFQNQLVEAAYRKELVHGEDDPVRASAPLCRELFDHVQKNYFTLYFHFMYFNIVKYSFLQADVIFPYMLMCPSISSGSLSMGQVTQTISAFRSVSKSFEFLVRSWKTIVELSSIVKRLQAFEQGISKEVVKDVCKIDPDSNVAPELDV